MPGQYTARLTVGGKTYAQTFTIKMDPRVKTPAAAIAQEHATRRRAVRATSRATRRSWRRRRALRDAASRPARTRSRDAALASAITAFDAALDAVVGQGGGGGRRGGGGGAAAAAALAARRPFASINGELMTLLTLLEEADAEPTTQAMTAVKARSGISRRSMRGGRALRTTELAALNAKLRAAGQAPIASPQ